MELELDFEEIEEVEVLELSPNMKALNVAVLVGVAVVAIAFT